MSINCVMLTQDGKAPVPLPQEKMFFTQPDVKLILDCNDEAGYPGNTGGHYESSRGTVVLTNQRIVYLVDKPTPGFQNLNVPILNFKQWRLEQPWFGANYVTGIVLPEVDYQEQVSLNSLLQKEAPLNLRIFCVIYWKGWEKQMKYLESMNHYLNTQHHQ
ncbi:hypothetical protein RMCBS344292_09024 [Rhizopus microsporus]|nr:hypothetical protein RMCBS344292_09024 [Rhizopus microsporus]